MGVLSTPSTQPRARSRTHGTTISIPCWGRALPTTELLCFQLQQVLLVQFLLSSRCLIIESCCDQKTQQKIFLLKVSPFSAFPRPPLAHFVLHTSTAKAARQHPRGGARGVTQHSRTARC